MKRMGILMLVVGLLVAALPSFAGEAKEAKLTTSSGEVVSVDPKASAVVVKVEETPGAATDVSFIVGKDAKIVKMGKPIALDGIMAGDRVTITFQNVNGKNMAVNVGVEAKPAA